MFGQSVIVGMGVAEGSVLLAKYLSEVEATPQELAAYKALVAAIVGGTVVATTADLVGAIPLTVGVVRYLQQAKMLPPEFSNLISTAQMLVMMSGHAPPTMADGV